MAPTAGKSLSNYMYDNQGSLQDAKYKKTSSCSDIIDSIGPNHEVWILTCPKGFVPATIIDTELRKVTKRSKVEVSATKFKSQMSIQCLTPQKSVEYDDVSNLTPVGKIIITELKSKESQKRSQGDDEVEIEDQNSSSKTPKKVKKIKISKSEEKKKKAVDNDEWLD